jgi:DNA-directed RNA polymerase specialized sigma subunit
MRSSGSACADGGVSPGIRILGTVDVTKVLRRLNDPRAALAVRFVSLTSSHQRSPPPLYNQEDVLSWGIIGLLDAIETHDPERQTKFES